VWSSPWLCPVTPTKKFGGGQAATVDELDETIPGVHGQTLAADLDAVELAHAEEAMHLVPADLRHFRYPLDLAGMQRR
jgi:hypothetical protein